MKKDFTLIELLVILKGKFMKKGLTIFELIIVLSTVALGLIFLVPAVNSAKRHEAARELAAQAAKTKTVRGVVVSNFSKLSEYNERTYRVIIRHSNSEIEYDSRYHQDLMNGQWYELKVKDEIIISVIAITFPLESQPESQPESEID